MVIQPKEGESILSVLARATCPHCGEMGIDAPSRGEHQVRCAAECGGAIKVHGDNGAIVVQAG